MDDTERDSKPTTIIPFEGIFNCRDVGKTINTFLGRKALVEGLLYRSGRLDDATSSDIDILKHDLRISSVIDLRTSTEHERRGMPSAPKAPPDSDKLSSPSTGRTSHGIKTREILFPPGGSFYLKAVFPMLTWWQILLVIFLFLIRAKAAMNKLIIRNAVEPLGLAGLARKWLEFCGPEIKQTMDIFASSPPGRNNKNENEENTTSDLPVLIHCTQGKDRTGLMTLLVLMLLLGTTVEAQDAIEFDYTMSNVGVSAMKEKMAKEMNEVGFRVGGAFAEAPRAWVGQVMREVEEKYGGIEKYLESIDVNKTQMDKIRVNFLVMDHEDMVMI